jgi:hypothetical protein
MNGVALLCGFCEEVPTHHDCIHPVQKGGLLMDGFSGSVCGQLIFAPAAPLLEIKMEYFTAWSTQTKLQQMMKMRGMMR